MIKKTDAFHRFPSLIKLLEITNFFSSTKKLLLILTLSLFAINIFNSSAHTASRIKDITDFEGVRDNMLVGYGLVVGLSGTGDSMKNGHFTKQSLKAMLNRLGVKPTDAGLDSKNVAAVMVTAKLPLSLVKAPELT